MHATITTYFHLVIVNSWKYKMSIPSTIQHSPYFQCELLTMNSQSYLSSPQYTSACFSNNCPARCVVCMFVSFSSSLIHTTLMIPFCCNSLNHNSLICMSLVLPLHALLLPYLPHLRYLFLGTWTTLLSN